MSELPRQYPRYATDAAVVVEGPDGKVEGNCANLSKGGLCAQMSGTLVPGHNYEVELFLVFDEDTFSESIRVPARAVWSTALNDGFQVGFQFLALNQEIAGALDMFLRFLAGSKS